MQGQDDQTFLFADLAGFTALTEAHGDEEAAQLAAEFGECLRPLLPGHGADEVKTIGDAMMIRVGEPAAAVELGLRIVEEVAARPQFPVVRVGMHTGPAVGRGGDWFGAAVNLAARVSGAAAGGEVLLTSRTAEAAGEMAGVEMRRHGERRFKNVREPVPVLRAVRRGSKADDRRIDPVCRMAVDPGEAVGQLDFGGDRYVFCSLDCLRSFAADPERYAPSGG